MKTVTQISAELADREAIRDCLFRYCRGIDRCDVDLLRSAYWPDATEDHVEFCGPAMDYVDWAMSRLQSMEQTHHHLGNIQIDIMDAAAYVESYILASHRVRQGADGKPYDLVSAGRYVDRMERREDEWRIAHRVVLRDWFRKYPDSADWQQGPHGTTMQPGGRKPDDRSYALLNPADGVRG